MITSSKQSLSLPRPARPKDARQITALVAEAIRTLPYYGEEFRAYEQMRLSEFYIRLLIASDPWHACVIEHGNEIVAFSLVIPDLGTLWSSWIYVKPDFRHTRAAVSLVGTHIRHWEGNRFYKIACYVHPDNTNAITIVRRFGFVEVALLRNHILGENFVLLERPLRKGMPGHDHGISLPRWRRWAIRLTMWLRR